MANGRDRREPVFDAPAADAGELDFRLSPAGRGGGARGGRAAARRPPTRPPPRREGWIFASRPRTGQGEPWQDGRLPGTAAERPARLPAGRPGAGAAAPWPAGWALGGACPRSRAV